MIVDQVTASVSLDNAGEVLILKYGSSIIDQTPSGTWAAGFNDATKHSMERNSIPGDGTLSGSWHTCISAGCNDSPFWDTHNGPNNGTPRATNLSENDTSIMPAHPITPSTETVESVVPTATFSFREDHLAADSLPKTSKSMIRYNMSSVMSQIPEHKEQLALSILWGKTVFLGKIYFLGHAQQRESCVSIILV